MLLPGEVDREAHRHGWIEGIRGLIEDDEWDFRDEYRQEHTPSVSCRSNVRERTIDVDIEFLREGIDFRANDIAAKPRGNVISRLPVMVS